MKTSKTINYFGEDYLKVDDALEYLDSREAVYELEDVYFCFKGFATEHALDVNANAIDIDNEQKRYLEGVCLLELSSSEYWEHYYYLVSTGLGVIDGKSIRGCILRMVSGLIDGNEIEKKSITEYLYNNRYDEFIIDPKECMFKKSDLDAVSKKFGIPLRHNKPEKTLVITLPVENHTKELTVKAETTYLHIIASLLGYIKGEVPSINKHPEFTNEAKLIEVLAEQYAGYPGMSTRTLQDKFAKAKKKIAE